MKAHTIYKSIQLGVFIVLALVAGVLIFAVPELFHAAASDPSVMVICIILWAVLLLSFLFIFLDFKYFLTYRKEYNEMDSSVHSDPQSGISNRFSCDMLIEQYLDEPLPENMGCITFMITNMQEINRVYGHRAGNTLIRDFSMILRMTAQGLCFVGRNGGNNFLALFENCTEAEMATFLEVLDKKVEAHNKGGSALPIRYTYGKAYHETDTPTITDLIALSNRRLTK